MQQTVIIGVVEPVSYSLESSTSWALVSALKRQETPLLNLGNGKFPRVCGAVPILQPVQLLLKEGPAYLVFLRLNIDQLDSPLVVGSIAQAIAGMPLASIGISGSTDGHSVGQICWGLASPLTMVMSETELQGLHLFVESTVRQLWPNVPINWTTHLYHLTSSGQYMSAEEIADRKDSIGAISLLNGRAKLISGSNPHRVAWFPRWSGGGSIVTKDRRRLVPRVARAAIDAAACGGTASSSNTGSSGNGSSSGNSGSSGSTFYSPLCPNCAMP